MALKVYLAGPDVFLPNARQVGEQKQRICREFGLAGLFPADNDDAVMADATTIFGANCSLMQRADIGVFNLTPFRGSSADPGTVFELGFMFAHGKAVYGYTSVPAAYRERVAATSESLIERNGQLWDPDGYAVENFGLRENLMIVRAIEESGGVFTAAAESGDASQSLAAFVAFRACVEIVRERTERGSLQTERPRKTGQSW